MLVYFLLSLLFVVMLCLFLELLFLCVVMVVLFLLCAVNVVTEASLAGGRRGLDSIT